MPNRRRGPSRYRQQALLRHSRPPDRSAGFRADEPMRVQQARTGADLLALDHVALAVADPGAAAAFLCDHVGMQELARTDDRVVVGGDGRAAPLMLVAAAGAREPGALARLVLRVADVERAVAALPAATAVEGDRIERAGFRGPEGLGLGFTLVAGGGIDYDLDHVVLRVGDPEQTRLVLAGLGFAPRAQSLHVGDKYVTVTEAPAATRRPLLHHIAVRVESLDAVAALAHARGLETEGSAEEGSLAVVLPGREQIRLRFVGTTPAEQMGARPRA